MTPSKPVSEGDNGSRDDDEVGGHSGKSRATCWNNWPHTSPEKRLATSSTNLLACLWTLANQESCRGVADRFDPLCHLHLFCTLVTTHMKAVITWPRGDALRASVQGFEKAGFANTVCAVDGCHIPILKPQCENALAYYNRKRFYSVILAAVCDGERRFCHVGVGHPGSWHDARAFRHTDVAQVGEDNPLLLVPEGMHIIADSAYPLLPQLMKPYRDNGYLQWGKKTLCPGVFWSGQCQGPPFCMGLTEEH
ncbi:LOW QUALITY PROTEIN: uncharacterized protein ACB057_008965 [Neosynchiropus ocellatus]